MKSRSTWPSHLALCNRKAKRTPCADQNKATARYGTVPLRFLSHPGARRFGRWVIRLLNGAAEQHRGAELGLDDRAGVNTRPIGWERLVAVVRAIVEAELGDEFRINHLQRRAAHGGGTDHEGDPLAGGEAASGKSLKFRVEFLARERRRPDTLLIACMQSGLSGPIGFAFQAQPACVAGGCIESHCGSRE